MAAQIITVNGSHRPVNFTPSPSLWGDQFINYISNPKVKDKYSEEIDVLKNEVRSMLKSTKMVESMNLIDTVERLGISYHFKNEIEEMLQHFFNLMKNTNYNYEDEAYDLYTVALHFRLFRQHGYPISSDIFGKWIDGNGRFQESLRSDARALLSLYEASYLRMHGETLLDKALDFTSANLKSMAPNLGSPLREQVQHALFQSLHFGVPRLEARYFISIYDMEQHRNETLLRFSKLDFNLLQILHKEELREVSRWWEDLNIISKFPYVRDRIVECYFWSVGIYHEPEYSRARIMLAKSFAVITILDDTFDSYGTIEELAILTETIQRWDIKDVERVLPEYIKEIYQTLVKIYEQFEEELAKDGRAYATHFAIEALKELTRAYYVEAKWFIKGYVPPFKEYLSNALITAGTKYLNFSSIIGMKSIMKKDFEWLSTKSEMIVATQAIGRLINDIASYEVEKEKGQLGSGIECYMKEKGTTKEEAIAKFNEMATNAWKDSNKECIGLTSNSRDVFMALLNFNRIVEASYKNNEDGYTKPEKVFKPNINALLVDQIEI